MQLLVASSSFGWQWLDQSTLVVDNSKGMKESILRYVLYALVLLTQSLTQHQAESVCVFLVV